MTWNYRVMRHIHDEGEPEYVIHEVYYDENGKVKNWTEEAVGISAESDISNLKHELEHVQLALTKPVLDYDTGEEI